MDILPACIVRLQAHKPEQFRGMRGNQENDNVNDDKDDKDLTFRGDGIVVSIANSGHAHKYVVDCNLESINSVWIVLVVEVFNYHPEHS